MSGQLYLISAPSGAGKTSMVSALIKQDEKIKLSVSHTTREPRAGEIDGKHYHFVSTAKFEQLVVNNSFLEHENVYDNLYGTEQKTVENLLEQNFDVILEIDWQGARQATRVMTQAISVCIAPPSIQTLRNRLEARGADSKKVIENRMLQAKQELEHLSDAQYVIINDNFSEAVAVLQAIFIANRHIYSQQKTDLMVRGLIIG